MPRLLLLLPTATYRAADFLAAASRLGAEVVVASERRQALARSMGDRALVVDPSQPERAAQAIVDLARRSPLDGIVAVDDQGVVAAAAAAERLGLPHNPPAAVARTRDKAGMRAALSWAGVPQPAWRLAGPEDDVGQIARQVGFPCVVKPVGLSASRGVIRADDVAAARAAGDRARGIARQASDQSGRPPGAASLLVESYVQGSEVALEGLLRGGSLEVLAVFDKPDPLEGPFFEETIYVTPSRLPPAALGAVVDVVAAAAAGLGLSEGPVHAEVRVAPGDGPVRAWLIELAARSIGGLCSRSLTFGTGVSLEEIIVAHALGRPFGDLRREDRAAGVMMLPIPAAGVLEGVGGQDRARAVPGITGLEISIATGRPVVPLPEGDRYLGFLFARGATPAEVEAALRRAHAELDIRIGPGPQPGSEPVTGSALGQCRSPEGQARFDEGLALRERRRWKAAADRFRAVAELEPEDAVARYWLAVTLDNRGQEADAIPAYREALRLGLQGEERAKAWTWLASSLSKTSQPEAALEALAEAEALGGYAPQEEFATVAGAVRRRVSRGRAG